MRNTILGALTLWLAKEGLPVFRIWVLMSYHYWNIQVVIAVELMGRTPVGPIFFHLMIVSHEQRVHSSPHLLVYRPCCSLVVMVSDKGQKRTREGWATFKLSLHFVATGFFLLFFLLQLI